MFKIKDKSGLLSAAEQTRLTWARLIEDCEHIPPAYQQAFNSHFPQPGEFPYCLLTPSFTGFLRPTSEKLVCCTARGLTIFEKYPERIDLAEYAFNSVNYVETGKVLLYSWLTVNGIDQRGGFNAATIRFNTVGEGLFRPILARMRPAETTSTEAEVRIEQAKFHYLGEISYKFMNFGRHSLRPGDRVSSIVFQPEQRKIILKLFQKSLSRLVSPAHLLILTDKEIIGIRDASRISTYGGIWDYIPLGKIRSVTLNKENNQLKLSLELLFKDTVDFPFELSRQAEVMSFQAELMAGMSGHSPGG